MLVRHFSDAIDGEVLYRLDEERRRNESTALRSGSLKNEDSAIAEAKEVMNLNGMRRFYAVINHTWHKTAPVPDTVDGPARAS